MPLTNPWRKPKLMITYSEQYLDWQLGNGDGTHPTNPVRAKLATQKLVARLGKRNVVIADPAPLRKQRKDLIAVQSVHTPKYVHQVLAGNSSEWNGTRPQMGKTALAMFGGTVRLVEAMIAGKIRVGFNPQGAKHHAYADHSSGFCVFNDMAWAAIELKKAGFIPLYIDWDIHAGDGVQAVLADTDIPTISIHNGQQFPFATPSPTRDPARSGERHEFSDLSRHFYNLNVLNGDGDEAFKRAIDRAAEIIDEYQPTVILLAAGADGHEEAGHLGKLNNYTYQGFEYAAAMVAKAAAKYAKGRVLIGGAGGYRPLDHTPEIWARVVQIVHSQKRLDALLAIPAEARKVR